MVATGDLTAKVADVVQAARALCESNTDPVGTRQRKHSFDPLGQESVSVAVDILELWWGSTLKVTLCSKRDMFQIADLLYYV